MANIVKLTAAQLEAMSIPELESLREDLQKRREALREQFMEAGKALEKKRNILEKLENERRI